MEQINTRRIKWFIIKRKQRKAYEDSNSVLSEITTENPNKDVERR